MAFDPDKYLQTTEGFNPDAYLGATPDNRGNIINSDVPTVVGTRPNAVNPQPQQAPRTVADYAKAFLEVPATIGSAAVAPFIGVGAGMIENIREGTNKRVDRPELGQRFTYEPTSPVAQDVVSSLGGALDAAKIPAYVPSAGNVARATQGAAQTIPSYAKAMAQELTAPVVQNPLVQKGVEMVQKGGETLKQKITPAPKTYSPSEKALSNIADSAFQRAKKEGVELDNQKFIQDAQDLIIDLRELGYDERLHPKVAVAIEILTNPEKPKDLTELKTIRKFMQEAQKSGDETEKMIGTELKHRFDEFLATIPKENLVGGSKEGLRSWREGQTAYSRLSKSQIFTDMMKRAEIDAKNIGVEKSLSNQLDALAKNDKRMRLFTKAEQEAITEAAKGGNVQNTLRFIGKFAPTNALSGLFGGSVIGLEPTVGVPLVAAASGARMGATKMRKTQIERLADAMRANPNASQQVDFSRPAANPITNNDRIAEILRRFNQGEQ